MSTTTPLRWGILSTANIGRKLTAAIRESRNGALAAVASRDAAKASAFAAETGIPRVVSDYDALLADDGIDAIYIPLPNAMHREWTIRAVNAGKHVLCEKPLALTAAECRAMRDAADANRVQLMEAFMYRFHPRTEAVLERVHAGALGTLTSINAHFGFRLTRPVNIRWNAELGGGAAMDVGCYCISAIRTLAGAEPVEVSARATWTDSGVDATLTGWIAFASGLVAHFGCSMAGERRELLEIIGTDAMFSIESAFVPGTGETEYVERRGGDVSRHVAAGANQYARMVEHFTDAVQLGTPLRYPASDGEANTAVIEALLRSARAEGRPERVATV